MNISFIHDCFGCGICAIACNKKVIDIHLGQDGFYEPFLTNPDRCTNCGVCVDVCSYSHDDISLKNPQITSYGAWSKDSLVRKKCSSGGVGFEIGRTAIEQGYKVCGVRYNPEKNQAEHYIATNITELIPSIGSKYIQSYTLDGFNSIDRKQKYLITGTPCQIDSFRRYIQKFRCEDNFVLVDFFCHGVPSKLLWDKYVSMHEKKMGKLIYASWRNKFDYGWHNSYVIGLEGKEKSLNSVTWYKDYNQDIQERKTYHVSGFNQRDFFYQFFLSDVCLGKACYDKCRFKYDQSSADIRIGDAWGQHYQDNEKGVSAAIAFTEKGHDILKMSQCVLEPLPFDIVAEGQMKNRPQRRPFTTIIMDVLMQENSTAEDIELFLKRYFKKRKFFDIVNHPKEILAWLLKKITK